ncbi:RAMP superfamily CRISPR-associated protein [Heliophilum fasciatum]|uniref:RAMP superfamily protein n=1 Tax=Heliophilum fasciatum TaxID=35700 RepID=A0A4R2RD79_9FIRM|nr:RAMP superfamily CRISPR-associated protein [Heliophilum fasciatum]MCW2279305.1 hypothetical protein [Heliophilum fasciatum]TCP60434.1 RAMP superfamily protein [Heliophilum fasciatum]
MELTLRFALEYQFIPDFGLKIGSGQSKYGVIDNTFRTRHDDHGNTIYAIPGTTVKGRIRSSYRRLAGLFPDEGIQKEAMYFGIPGKAGCLHFLDLKVSEDSSLSLIEKASTAIERLRRAAKSESLHVEEYMVCKRESKEAIGEAIFSGFIEGVYRGARHEFFSEKSTKDTGIDKIPAHLAYLLLAVKSTQWIGGDKSGGWGKGKIQFKQLEWRCFPRPGQKGNISNSDLLRMIKNALQEEGNRA